MMNRLTLFALLLTLALGACGRPAAVLPIENTKPPAHAEQELTSFLAGLPSAEYPVDVTRSGNAPLENGYYEEPIAPDSATKIAVQLKEEQSLGDLNGDEIEDAAVLLEADPGGSGTFIYLSAVLNENGVASPISSIELGDRIIVKTLTIQDGYIIVTLLTRKPEEPFTAKPTLEVVRTFKLQGNKLIAID
jgi:hypothetical protein